MILKKINAVVALMAACAVFVHAGYLTYAYLTFHYSHEIMEKTTHAAVSRRDAPAIAVPPPADRMLCSAKPPVPPRVTGMLWENSSCRVFAARAPW